MQLKKSVFTISGLGTGEDSLEELGECKSDEFSPAWLIETDTWKKITYSK